MLNAKISGCRACCYVGSSKVVIGRTEHQIFVECHDCMLIQCYSLAFPQDGPWSTCTMFDEDRGIIVDAPSVGRATEVDRGNH